MKSCPQCAADYYDEMLEFCLEDGAKLFTVSKNSSAVSPIFAPPKPNPFTEKTFTGETQTIESIKPNDVRKPLQNGLPNKETLSANSKVLEIAPVISALAHNWWQWLYATNQTYSSISGFLVSANFLMWLLLLAIGAGIGLLAVKRCQNKGYAVVSLVILAINLILFLVPKR